jgi:ABC-type glucose/galactose transport system permease subunit
MPKLLAIVTSLKGILITAGVAFARGDMLPVILISVLFNLAYLGAKPFGQAAHKATIVILARDDPPRGSADA